MLPVVLHHMNRTMTRHSVHSAVFCRHPFPQLDLPGEFGPTHLFFLLCLTWDSTFSSWESGLRTTFPNFCINLEDSQLNISGLSSYLAKSQWVGSCGRRSSSTAPCVLISPMIRSPYPADTATAWPASKTSGARMTPKGFTAAPSAARPSAPSRPCPETPCWPKLWSSSAKGPSNLKFETPSEALAGCPLDPSPGCPPEPFCATCAKGSSVPLWKAAWHVWAPSARPTWSLTRPRSLSSSMSSSRRPAIWQRRSAPSTSTCRSSSVVSARCLSAGCAPAISTKTTSVCPPRLSDRRERCVKNDSQGQLSSNSVFFTFCHVTTKDLRAFCWDFVRDQHKVSWVSTVFSFQFPLWNGSSFVTLSLAIDFHLNLV